MKISLTELGVRCHRAWQEAELKRMQMVNVFKQLGDYARPSVDAINSTEPNHNSSKSTARHTRLFDSTLMNSVEQHASGIKAWMSPANSFWFQVLPDDAYNGDDEVAEWHSRVSQIMERQINLSNFHAEDFEAVIDGAAFGTRHLLITESPPGIDKPFIAQRWDPNTFSMTENAEGFVDGVYATKNYTPKQAVQKFGEDMVPDSVLQKFKLKPEDSSEEQYVLCIYKRMEDERITDSPLAEDMEIASVWIHATSKKVVRNSGHEDMPAIVSRHLKWSGTPFGIAPAIKALADARQLNSLQCSLDLLADVAANPRLLIPVEQEGNVNLMPGGPTYYADPNRIPRTWGSEGTYVEGQNRVTMRRQDIERALNLDVFRTFRNITKEITATEALEIRQEAIDLFSPVFSLMSTEHYERVLMRIFNILLRQGYFPPVPEKMMIPISDTEATIMPPKVSFTSRMAMAISQRHKAAIDESLQRRLGVASIIGEAAFDDIKVPEALKLIDQGNGLPAHLHRTNEELAQLQEARRQQQAAAQQMQMMEQAATAAGKLKGTGVLEAATA
jgi:hypothetical protein